MKVQMITVQKLNTYDERKVHEEQALIKFGNFAWGFFSTHIMDRVNWEFIGKEMGWLEEKKIGKIELEETQKPNGINLGELFSMAKSFLPKEGKQ